MYEHILSELGPWCLAEQDFCVRFFNLTANDERDSVQVCSDFFYCHGAFASAVHLQLIVYVVFAVVCQCLVRFLAS